MLVLPPLLIFTGFGQTPAQCEAAFGKANLITKDKDLVCPETRGYVKDGYSIMVGFNEAGKTEQFVISMATFPAVKTDLSTVDQKEILEAFCEKSAWSAPHDNGNGPI